MAGLYRIYTDKPTHFECKLRLEGASLSSAKARLILESPTRNFLFEGKISKGGKCFIPIEKLRGILPEDTKGILKLEVIADDTYFQPWSSPCLVTASKKLRVEVTTPKPEKSKIQVEVVDPYDVKVQKLTTEIVKSLRKRNITAENVMQKRKLVSSFIRETLERYNGDIDRHELLTNVVNSLAEGK